MPSHQTPRPEGEDQDLAAQRVRPHGDPLGDLAPHEIDDQSSKQDVAAHETQPSEMSPDDADGVREEEPPADGVALDGTPVDQLQEERAQRLDPDNRPDRAEVDNTQRDFDAEKGMFTDHPDYESAPKKFPPLGEQGA